MTTTAIIMSYTVINDNHNNNVTINTVLGDTRYRMIKTTIRKLIDVNNVLLL